MSGLRAEDVKEALEEAENDVTYQAEILASEHPWPTVVAAARLWLASQEQTPDYEAAAKVRFLQGEGTEAGWERNKAELKTPEPDRHVVSTMRRQRKYAEEIIDAALGIHPQNEGDER